MIKEIYGNLFDYENEYYLAHCISADCVLGAGIAVEFNKRYDMRNKLMKYSGGKCFIYPTCILIDKVFNLITKEKCFHKPTYKTLLESLIIMKEIAIKYNIKKIAMPTIGCGLDKLNWDNVRDIIYNLFRYTDIEILIVKKG